LFYNNSTKEITRGTTQTFVKTNNAVAIGNNAGNDQGAGAIAIGNVSGQSNQSGDAVAIGNGAGYNGQSEGVVAIGTGSGANNQGTFAVSIGAYSGATGQGQRATSVGIESGYFNQGAYCIAIGAVAGFQDQSERAIAIGYGSAYDQQGSNAVAIGDYSAHAGQGLNAVAIGSQAGRQLQGNNSIAIGFQAGQTNQAANSIVLNASGVSFPVSNSNAFYVNPIRSTNGAAGGVYYDSSTKELTYSSSKTFVIEHPIESNKYLVHACLEGPEAGVYYRGKSEITNDESVEIILPEYAKTFSEFTVQITPILSRNDIYVSEVEDGKFTVYGKNGKFFWLVNALRESIKVETLKCDTEVRGDGPYKYIYRA
jgi:hypothetical protein